MLKKQNKKKKNRKKKAKNRRRRKRKAAKRKRLPKKKRKRKRNPKLREVESRYRPLPASWPKKKELIWKRLTAPETEEESLREILTTSNLRRKQLLPKGPDRQNLYLQEKKGIMIPQLRR